MAAKKSTARKKTNNKSKTKASSNTKKNVANKSSKQTAAKSSKESNEKIRLMKYEVNSIIILGIASVILVCVLTGNNMGFIGRVISDVMKHSFGLGALLIPSWFIYYSIQRLRGKGKESNFKFKSIISFVFLMVFVSVTHVLTYRTEISGSLPTYIREVYNTGSLKNGGLMGGLIGGALIKAFGQAGAYIILVVMLVVLFILATGKSITAVFNAIGEWIDGARDEAEDYYSNDYEDDTEAEEADKNTHTKPQVQNKPVNNQRPPKKQGLLQKLGLIRKKEPQPKSFTPYFPVNIQMKDTEPKNYEAITIEDAIVNRNFEEMSKKKEIPDNIPHLSEKILEAEMGTEKNEPFVLPTSDDSAFDRLINNIQSNENKLESYIPKREHVTFEEETPKINIPVQESPQVTQAPKEEISATSENDWIDDIDFDSGNEDVIEDTIASEHSRKVNSILDNARRLYKDVPDVSEKMPEDVKQQLNIGKKDDDTPPWEDNDAPDVELSSNEELARQTLKELNARNEVRPTGYQKGKEPVIYAVEEEKTVDKLSIYENDETPEYKFPKLEFLAQNPNAASGINKQAILDKACKLEYTLSLFGVNAKVNNISRGPAVTRYELTPPEGMKVSKIESLENEIALGLAAKSVRIEAPIPGTSSIGIEIPNDKISAVYFREILSSEKFDSYKSKTAFGIGKDITGNVIVSDIAKMPHLLIAGATGSGKSVCVNSLITSILYKAHPDEVKLILIDPKVVELSVYNDIPHLLVPVVTDPHKAAGALNWAVREMDRRYNLFASIGARKLENYNKDERAEEKLPQIVIIIDELADLMLIAKKEVEGAIQRLTQLARAAGIHLVIATQRPSVNVITGVIKANVPSRIAFKVASAVDSRTILDTSGAEKLLGKGDMLFRSQDMDQALRIQGAFVSDEEVERIVDYIKLEEPRYDIGFINDLEAMDNDLQSDGGSGEERSDDLVLNAIEFVVNSKKASISSIQRKFKIGYNKAANIMDELEERGIVGPDVGGTKGREVLMDKYEFQQWKQRRGDY